MHSESKDRRKPEKKKQRTSQGRFAFHMCYHGDAWLGVDELSGLATGIYWKIILRMYIRRAALTDDDADLARLFNESLKNYRRAKKELLSAGRIICEDGLLYDERACRELVGLERYSQAQADRAKARHKGAPAPPRVVVDNVAPLSPTSRELLHELSTNSLTKSDSSQASEFENIPEILCREHANPESNTHITEGVPTRRAGRAAQPPSGGGAPLSREEIERRLADQRRRLGLTPLGKDDGAEPETRTAPQKPKLHSKAADRVARRL